METYSWLSINRRPSWSSSVVGLCVWVKFYPKHNYFVPFECFAGSETCFFCFLFSSFSRSNFLCCSKPAAFFSLLDKTPSTLTGNRSVTHSKALSFCLHLKGVYSIPILLLYPALTSYLPSLFCCLVFPEPCIRPAKSNVVWFGFGIRLYPNNNF